MSNFVQAQKFILHSNASISDTTVTVKDFVGLDGSNLTLADFGTKGFATLNPGVANAEEAISFTGVTQNGDGTATLTGVSTQLTESPYTETSGLSKSHISGATFVLSNTAGFYDHNFVNKNEDQTIDGTYTFTDGNTPKVATAATDPTDDAELVHKKFVDDNFLNIDGSTSMTGDFVMNGNDINMATGGRVLGLTDAVDPQEPATLNQLTNSIAGAPPNASETVKGVVQEATDAQVANGDATGSTGAKLFVPPSKLLISGFGDGSDGSYDIDGTNTYPELSKSGSIYTMTQDINATDFEVPSGSTLVTDGFRLFVSGTLSGGGVIQYAPSNALDGANGGNANQSSTPTTGAGGSYSAGGYFKSVAGSAGGPGDQYVGNGANGTAGLAKDPAILDNQVADGGNGGNTSSRTGGTGGAGGVGSAPVSNWLQTGFTIHDVLENDSGTFNLINPASGAGGGGSGGAQTGGSENYSGAGGGGGASAGVIWISARYVTGTFNISNIGGAGGNGGDGDTQNAGGGGGAGGAGGINVLIYGNQTDWSGSHIVTGGTGGSAGAIGSASGATNPTAGQNGVAGVAYDIKVTSIL